MASVSAGLALLERAAGFALDCAGAVTPGKLASPTPCDLWDLRALLAHAGDSAVVLRDAISSGCVRHAATSGAGSGGGGPGRRQDPAAAFRADITLLLGACAAGGAESQVAIGDRHLAVALVGATGAVELAVHGWDIAAACGPARPIPSQLAGDLLEIALLVVTDATRTGLFGAPVRIGPLACQGDRLLALLGRTPPG